MSVILATHSDIFPIVDYIQETAKKYNIEIPPIFSLFSVNNGATALQISYQHINLNNDVGVHC